VKSGEVRALTERLDRAVLSPAFAADGRSLEFAVEDDGTQYPARVPLTGGAIERLGGPMVVHELAAAARHTAVLVSTDGSPVEVYALEQGRLRPLSAHNQALFGELQLDRSRTSPSGAATARRCTDSSSSRPTTVRAALSDHRVDPRRTERPGRPLPRAAGLRTAARAAAVRDPRYAVLAVNYRGSTGRGAQFARSILADWGHKEVEDLLAGVDYAVGNGIADPARLGSAAGATAVLLTDYLIASDTRFKAAISGAGSGNQLSTYAPTNTSWNTTPNSERRGAIRRCGSSVLPGSFTPTGSALRRCSWAVTGTSTCR